MTTIINSAAQFNQILGATPVVIAYFTATWCGPCKMISPTFESLAKAHARAGKLAFAKIDVDSQQDVAGKYGVRSMPTFLVLHQGTVVQTVQGASPPALTAAVDKAVKLAGAGTPFRSGGGQRLGGSGVAASGRQMGLARPMTWDLKKILDAITTFFGLYFVSLISFDPYKSAQDSPFNKMAAPRTQGQPGTTGTKPPVRSGVRTLADL